MEVVHKYGRAQNVLWNTGEKLEPSFIMRQLKLTDDLDGLCPGYQISARNSLYVVEEENIFPDIDVDEMVNL